MANTDEIKKRLNRYRRKATECEALRKEVEYAAERYGDIRAVNFDGISFGKSGKNNGSTENAVLRKIGLEEKLQKYEAELESDWRLIEPFFEVLTPAESLLIRLRYYYAADWDNVCKRLYGDKSDYIEEQESYKNRMFIMHGRALSALATALQKNSLCAQKMRINT